MIHGPEEAEKSAKGHRIPWDKCTSCTSKYQYHSAKEALSHIHSSHTRCSNDDKYASPFDDPCYVWLLAEHHTRSSKRYSEIIRLLHLFIYELRGLYQKATQLQLVVACSEAGKAAVKGAAPPLPSSLVHAFEDIVMFHIITAKRLSLANQWMVDDDRVAGRRKRGPSGDFLDKVSDLLGRGDQCLEKAAQSLERAWTDIMLHGTTNSSGASISLDSIGVEFLVAVLIGNLQNEGVDADSRPNGLLELYQKYTARLQFEANRKPERKVFLDIQALQEELGALQCVVDSQKRLLASYLKYTSPNASRTTTPARRSLYPLENRYINRLQHGLIQRETKLVALQTRSRGLREQVRQSIDILEEGHGKAIRVFTIVTLFFLPMCVLTLGVSQRLLTSLGHLSPASLA